MTVLRPAFIAASLAWALLLTLVPFIASRPQTSPAGTALIIAVYAIGSAVCHQRPERSYHLWTAQMPVCARCAGIYFGAALMAIFAVVQGVQSRDRRPIQAAPRTRGTARLMLVVAALPALATLVYEWTTGDMPAHWIRTATGVPLGATVAWMVLSSMPHRTRAKNQVN